MRAHSSDPSGGRGRERKSTRRMPKCAGRLRPGRAGPHALITGLRLFTLLHLASAHCVARSSSRPALQVFVGRSLPSQRLDDLYCFIDCVVIAKSCSYYRGCTGSQ
ncbi:hypothetical protein PENSPDRAFT_297530 [Peniophora sp. CONT]|nr:hypothetical protein PENSPDRAFT_297530 [Peniophora sp. CONT]